MDKNNQNNLVRIVRAADHANRHGELAKIITRLKEIKDICRANKWYASACYASMAADSLFHMTALGDKAQRPDYIVNLTDVHYSCYPDDENVDEDGCI